jgi:hypothetical protein
MLTLAENVAYWVIRLFHETDLKVRDGILVSLFSKFNRHARQLHFLDLASKTASQRVRDEFVGEFLVFVGNTLLSGILGRLLDRNN